MRDGPDGRPAGTNGQAQTKPEEVQIVGPRSPEKTRRTLGIGLRIIAVGVIAAAIAVGMGKLDHHVHAQPQFAGPPQIVLLDVPEGLEPIIRQGLAPATQMDWIDPQLCRRIGA